MKEETAQTFDYLMLQRDRYFQEQKVWVRTHVFNYFNPMESVSVSRNTDLICDCIENVFKRVREFIPPTKYLPKKVLQCDNERLKSLISGEEPTGFRKPINGNVCYPEIDLDCITDAFEMKKKRARSRLSRAMSMGLT